MSAAESAESGHPGEARTVKRRRLLVWGLIVLAAIVVLVASLTVWVKRQALDTDAWTTASASLLQDEKVREALSVYIVDQLYANVDVEGELEDDLPPATQGPRRPDRGRPAGARTARGRPVPRAATRSAGVGAAQPGRARASPRGPRGAAQAERVDEQRRGHARPALLPRRHAGNEVGIGERLDATLPADAGQVVILESDQLSTAQDAVKAIKALSWVFGIVTFGLWGLALWLADGWRRVALARHRREPAAHRAASC